MCVFVQHGKQTCALCWSQRLGRGLDFGEPAVRRSSYSLNATLHPGLITDCRCPTNQRHHELTMGNVGTVWGLFEHSFFSTMGSQRNGFRKESFILSVDVGTTSVRCHVYDKEAQIRGSCTTKVSICLSLLPWWSRTPPTRSDWNFYFFRNPFPRLFPCIQMWVMWRWTQMRYGKGSSLWWRELFKVQSQH